LLVVAASESLQWYFLYLNYSENRKGSAKVLL
jgi:hypothetical protein